MTEIKLNNLAEAGNGAVNAPLRLGLDVDLRNVVVAIGCGRGAIGLARKYSREQLIAWVREKVAAGHTVYTVYECCGFGYTLHEQLEAAGAQSIITTPMRLNLDRRRKNDRMDARELCVRLSRYLDGQKEELKPIRIASRVERERRELGRQREFWKRELRRLENHGRALRIEHEHETLSAGWAGPRKWKQIAPHCSACVRGQLQPVVEQIRAVAGALLASISTTRHVKRNWNLHVWSSLSSFETPMLKLFQRECVQPRIARALRHFRTGDFASLVDVNHDNSTARRWIADPPKVLRSRTESAQEH